MTAGPATRLGILSDPNLGCFWLARTLSLIGDYAFRVAFVTYIISVSDSPTVLAVATAVLLLPPLVFYLVGGVTGDRVGSRRQVLVAADAARFITLLLIAAGTFWTDSVPVLVGLAVLIGIADGFFQPVSFAYLLEITPKDKLVTANSALSISQQIGLVVGPLLGGFLVGFAGPSATFGFDALTFLVSGVLLLLIRPQVQTAPATAAEKPERTFAGRGHLRQLLSEVADGVRYVTGVQWLLVSMMVGACANAVYAGVLDVAIPLILSPKGIEGAESLGGYYALQGIGAVIGAAILARLMIRRLGVTLYGMLATMAVALAMVGVIGGGPAALAMAVVYGIGLHFCNTLFPALIQERIPEALMSRVGSLAYLGFNGLMPLGALVMGPLAAALNARNAATLAGALAACVALAALLAPGVRRLRRDAPDEGADAADDSRLETVSRTS
ncbi:MAG TPA: MFS transporter [Micromonosporaceae bacterium]